ncbi:MAG: BamA/TamA family outer membrane protein [Melioribacteraceae bacterium]|nr:BamA/TamA family outer membrane protein [Melioribacteraceae bacterium]
MKKLIYTVLIFSYSLIFSQATDTLNLNLIEKNYPFNLTAKEPAKLKNIALALSGGGSRGLTHIGVMKALLEEGIDFDLIVGTSMGSIVGGLLASGYSISEIESIAVHTDWNEFFTSVKRPRQDLFIDQKITEDRSLVTLKMDGLTPVIPTSISSGERVTNFLNILSLNAPLNDITDFDDYLIRFRAVATNLTNGEPVVLKNNSLSLAMRSSSSVSFLLPPVQLDSLILVDGGLVANIPTEIANDIFDGPIVAVDATSPLKTPEELLFPWDVADQVVTIPMKIISEQQLNLADIAVVPNLSGIENTDFSRIEELIKQGYSAGKSAIDSIIKIVRNNYFASVENEKFYTNISLKENASETEVQLFNLLTNTNRVSSKEIEFGLAKIYKCGDFEELSAVITDSENKSFIEIIEKKNPLIKKLTVLSHPGFERICSVEDEKELINKPYNSKRIMNFILSVLRQCRKKGNSLTRFLGSAFSIQSGELTLNFSEARISGIEVTGNVRTETQIITREFPNVVDNPFSLERIEEGLRNLNSTNLFNLIEAEIKIAPDGSNVLVINVDEKTTSVLRLGLRVDNEYLTQLYVDIREENLLGSAIDLGLIISGGTRSRNFILENRSNRLFNTYLTYNLKAYYQFNDVNRFDYDSIGSSTRYERSKIAEYRQIGYGFSAGIGTQVKRYANLIAEGKYEINEVKNLRDFPDKETYKDKIVSLKLKLLIDTQDRYPYPQSGFYLNSFYETSQTILGGDISFVKFLADYKSYFSFSSVGNLYLRFRFGFGDHTLPLSQQFSLGGQNNFFGMRNDEFRGRQIFSSSIGYRHKIPFNIFFPAYIKFRYDIGSIWANREDIRFKDLRHGLGATLSIDSPLGPADFSVGKSVEVDYSSGITKLIKGPLFFYFSIGYEF